MNFVTVLLSQGYYSFFVLPAASKLSFQANGERKTIIWIGVLQRPCTSPINPHSFPGFPVTRTLPYLSEGQMTFFLSLQLRTEQQKTAVNAQIEGTCCLVTMIFAFHMYIYIWTLFNYHVACVESIKSRWLAFLQNLYCTSNKRPTSIKRPVFKVPRGAA